MPAPRSRRSLLIALLIGLSTGCLSIVGSAAPAHASEPGRDRSRGLTEGRSIEAEDVALAVPRAVLAVPDVLLGIVFRPIRLMLVAVQKHAVPERVESIFVVARDASDAPSVESSAVVLPSLTASSWYGVQLGVSALDDDLGGHGESIAGKATLGPSGDRLLWWHIDAPGLAGTPLWLDLEVRAVDHPTVPFRRNHRFRQRSFDERGIVGAATSVGVFDLRLGALGRVAHHAPGDAPEDAVVQQVDRGGPLDEGSFTVGELGGAAVVVVGDDAAWAEVDVTRGGVVHGTDLARVHGEVGGVVEVLGPGRRLGVWGTVDHVEGLDGSVPLLDQPSLGGPTSMPGRPLFDQVAPGVLAGGVTYQYPVHELFAGVLHAEVGTVFDDRPADLPRTTPRWSAGGGLELGSPDRRLVHLDVSGGDGVNVVIAFDPLRPFVEHRRMRP